MGGRKNILEDGIAVLLVPHHDAALPSAIITFAHHTVAGWSAFNHRFQLRPHGFLPVNFFQLLFVGIVALRPQFHGNSPGQAEAGNEATQCYFFLCHCESIHQPEQLFPAFFVQQGGNFLAFCFELSALLLFLRFGVEPVLQCPHVFVHGLSLPRSDKPYHRPEEIFTTSRKNYQFRHIFFTCSGLLLK